MSDVAAIEANSRAMSSFYDYLLAGNVEGVLSLFDPDIEIHEPDPLPFGGIYRGLAEVGNLFAGAAKYFSPTDITVEAITAGRDRAVGLLKVKVATRDEPVAVAEEAVFSNGKIVRIRVFHYNPNLVAG